jgi:hypothetical protein
MLPAKVSEKGRTKAMRDSKPEFPKGTLEKIGRTFAIMFNRVSIYQMEHPFTVQSMEDGYKTFVDGLDRFSPLTLMLNRDHFFLEEAPFDQHLNHSRMAAHFKKAGIQSISFEKGMQPAELDHFLKIFTDSKTYPTAESMRHALTEKRVSNIKINHVLYKKVTEDDAIVSKEQFQPVSSDTQDEDATEMVGEVIQMMAESILAEEMAKSFSMEDLLADPQKLSQDLIERDLSLSRENQSGSARPGFFIGDQLLNIRRQIDNVAESNDKVSLSELADSVFHLKQQLIAGIESQKALGIIYANEMQIVDEVNALSDQVLIQLVREEYRKGEISIQRLAQIIRRLMPEPAELRRLLPKLSAAMRAEGMSKADFLQLLDALAKELQNDDVMQFLQQGAAEIGLTSEDLIAEIKIDPSGAAELIYLASEIRKGGGDQKVLADLLVDYIERIGTKVALDDLSPARPEEKSHLRQVLARVESEIVNKLGQKGVDRNVLEAVQERLAQRLEHCFEKLQADWRRRQEIPMAGDGMAPKTVFRVLEESVREGEELYHILQEMRSAMHARGIDENNFQQIYAEICRLRRARETNKDYKTLPEGILNHKNTRLLIEKEIFRSLRYDTPFSMITFSIQSLTPLQPVPRGAITGPEINHCAMAKLLGVLRDADLVGILTKQIIVVLLPMTAKMNAKAAMSRILKALHAEAFHIKGIALKVKFAGAVTSFNPEQTPDFLSFVRMAENEHNDFLTRLKNVYDLY